MVAYKRNASHIFVLGVLKCAFNSQSDIVIITDFDVIFIEAKLESKEQYYGPKKVLRV